MGSEVPTMIAKGGIQRKGTLNGINTPRTNPSAQVVDKSRLLSEIKDDAAEELVKQLQQKATASLVKEDENAVPPPQVIAIDPFIVVGDIPTPTNNDKKEKPRVKRSIFVSCFTHNAGVNDM